MVGNSIKHVWFEHWRAIWNMSEREGQDIVIKKWFPITEVSVESVRERSAVNSLPPLYFLHVWFARRPLATSRAAILGSLLPDNVTDRDFLGFLGIPANVDTKKAQDKLMHAKACGIHLTENPYSWTKTYEHIYSAKELDQFYGFLKAFWGPDRPIVFDPMAGGGSIPFEALRLGLPVIAGDLNPVAFTVLKGTLEYPARFGSTLLPAVETFCSQVHEAAKKELEEFFPTATR